PSSSTACEGANGRQMVFPSHSRVRLKAPPRKLPARGPRGCCHQRRIERSPRPAQNGGFPVVACGVGRELWPLAGGDGRVSPGLFPALARDLSVRRPLSDARPPPISAACPTQISNASHHT